MYRFCLIFPSALALVIILSGDLSAQDATVQAIPVDPAGAVQAIPVDPAGAAAVEKRSNFFKKLFGKKQQFDPAPEGEVISQAIPVEAEDEDGERDGKGWRLRNKRTDRKSDTIARVLEDNVDEGESAERENDGFERYPHLKDYDTKHNKAQKEIEDLIDRIYGLYQERIDRMNPPDLSETVQRSLAGVPADFRAKWRGRVQSPVWENQKRHCQSIDQIYTETIAHSNQVRVFSDIPLIRETGLQEADGEFDVELFGEGRRIRRNQPSGSTLVTRAGLGRFIEDEDYLEGGLRKKFFPGTEVSVSNRFSTRDNNSTFLVPPRQGESELVLSVVQPLLEGGGYHYNHSKIKIAKLDSRMASSEFIRQLQTHLLEVNRAYWSLYYARASYILKKDLVDATGTIVKYLAARSDFDALESEILRARASHAHRKASLIRAEMAIRNNEERLRAMINDPQFEIGSNNELIPQTYPILSRCVNGVQSVAREALHNRPEIQQGFDLLRAAVVRRDMQKNERKPVLNLIAETMLGDLKPNENVGGAFSDQFGEGPGYVFGFSFEQELDNDEARARLVRREMELRQQANQLKVTIDTVLLEAVVTYRELITSYRDMQGAYEALRASREELQQLYDRLDTDLDGGQTLPVQLQLILDSMDRRQEAEETFLDSVVAYNASFAGLERAKGTFLRFKGIEIKRIQDTDATHPDKDFEMLELSKAAADGGKNGLAKSGLGGKSGVGATGGDQSGLRYRRDPQPMVPDSFTRGGSRTLGFENPDFDRNEIAPLSETIPLTEDPVFPGTPVIKSLDPADVDIFPNPVDPQKAVIKSSPDPHKPAALSLISE